MATKKKHQNEKQLRKKHQNEKQKERPKKSNGPIMTESFLGLHFCLSRSVTIGFNGIGFSAHNTSLP